MIRLREKEDGVENKNFLLRLEKKKWRSDMQVGYDLNILIKLVADFGFNAK